MVLGTKTVRPTTLVSTGTKVSLITTTTTTVTEQKRSQKTVYPRSETFEKKTNHSIDTYYFGTNAANIPPTRNRRREGQNKVQQRKTQNSPPENA